MLPKDRGRRDKSSRSLHKSVSMYAISGGERMHVRIIIHTSIFFPEACHSFSGDKNGVRGFILQFWMFTSSSGIVL